MNKKYYFFNIEIALKKESDSNIYAFVNVSHIPTEKLIEIFHIDLSVDPYLLEGYFLKKGRYKKYKKYITENIGPMDLDIFEYCLRQYVAEGYSEIRKLYKDELME